MTVTTVKKMDMLDSVQPPICTSCGKIIHPKEKAVVFYCPNCGSALIWRCSKCRKQGIKYQCPNCGFIGP